MSHDPLCNPLDIKQDPVVLTLVPEPASPPPQHTFNMSDFSQTKDDVQAAVSNGIAPPSFPLPVRSFKVSSGLTLLTLIRLAAR